MTLSFLRGFFLIVFLLAICSNIYSQFSAENTIAAQGDTRDPRHISSADLDNDGDIDVISTAWQANAIYWFQNDGKGNFSERKLVSTASGSQKARAYHIDDDNYIDIISSSSKSGEIVWYKNDSIGNFSSKKIIGIVNGAGGIYGADLDNDKDIDVLATAFERDKVVWYRNDGNGNFSNEIVIEDNWNAVTSVGAADLDADQDLDVFFVGLSDRGVKWYENDGTGVFSARSVLGNFNLLSEVNAVDLEGDGYMDILTTSIAGDFSLVYRNNKDGSFTGTRLIGGSSISSADLNKDQYSDIVITSFKGNQVAWFEGKRDRTFGSEQIISNTLGEAKGIIISDFDGDNYLDVAAGSSVLNKVVWFRNLFNKSSIKGFVFWDINTNAIFDDEEPLLNKIPVFVTPRTTFAYTEQDGSFCYFLEPGDYNISVQPNNNCWAFSTTPDNYDFTAGDSIIEVNFGLKLISDFQHTQARINSAPTRCGFTVAFHLSVENDGCLPSKGQYGIVLDSLVTFVNADIMPTAINGDTLLWDYQELLSQENEKVSFDLRIAGTDFIGSFIQLKGLSYILNTSGQQELVSTHEFTSEIRCAFDPNDKLVSPQRVTSRSNEFNQNYTLFEELLEYTVRFQNTGNDTAFTVVIEDQLDDNLDWFTFQPIVSSHFYEVELDNAGLLTFTFSDILLPDSTTNEPLSHGFITYKIRSRVDLEESTIIENKADIFFDFNPPITTNTTNNVMVSVLPTMTTSIEAIDLPNSIALFPNPFQHQLFIDATAVDLQNNYQIEFFDISGHMAQTLELSTTTISTTHWPAGLYTYRLVNTKGIAVEYGKLVKL